MRIVFMGTPDFAVPTLQALLTNNYSIVGVFTQPDKPKGRGYKLTPSPVKQMAISHDLPVFQPAKMRDGEALALLQELKPDLIVVVAYGKILPMDILDLPKYGCINVHGSLLPKYRGAAPIQWSVINGDKLAGVTTMYMAEGMDTGDILLKKSTPILPNETSGMLYERLATIGAALLIDTLKQRSTIIPEKQDDTLSSHAPMLD
ncbi:MAG: methionyl-tRNA formyltransferase, partial [Oscillospiraceae bacterium]